MEGSLEFRKALDYIWNILPYYDVLMIIVDMIGLLSITTILLGIFYFCALRYISKRLRTFIKKEIIKTSDTYIIAFFHPNANDGGGGEKVLFQMIHALQDLELELQISKAVGADKIKVIVYIGQINDSKMDILKKVKERFCIDINPEFVDFVEIVKCKHLNPSNYPRLTMLQQAFMSQRVIIEAILRYPPDMLIDTMGFGFIYPLAKWMCKPYIIAMTHYPFIQQDMINKVREGKEDYNNNEKVAKSKCKTFLKIKYYQLILLMYKLMGRATDQIISNGTWTSKHMQEIWKTQDKNSFHTLFPPCQIPKDIKKDTEAAQRQIILSFGQFRREKDQMQQIHILKDIMKEKSNVQLRMLGSVRTNDDYQMVNELMNEAVKCGLEIKLCDGEKEVKGDMWKADVLFMLNLPWHMILREFQLAIVGLHTMIDEHFGITVVEMMAAKLIVVAHNSGGPKLDIIGQNEFCGYLANDKEGFVRTIITALELYEAGDAGARNKVDMFSDDNFLITFSRIILDCLGVEKKDK